MREAEVLDGDGHAAGVGVGDLDVYIRMPPLPGKPMAPKPVELPNSSNSASSAATSGSGLRSPTSRRPADPWRDGRNNPWCRQGQYRPLAAAGHATPKEFADAIEEEALDTRDAVSGNSIR